MTPEPGLDEVGNPSAFTIRSPFVSSADMQCATEPDPLRFTMPASLDNTQTNVHLCSYIETHPSITPRVSNETAVIVDDLNSIPH